jgi:hypothetical protein
MQAGARYVSPRPEGERKIESRMIDAGEHAGAPSRLSPLGTGDGTRGGEYRKYQSETRETEAKFLTSFTWFLGVRSQTAKIGAEQLLSYAIWIAQLHMINSTRPT